MTPSDSHVAEKPHFEAVKERAHEAAPVLIAVFLGLFMLMGVGFAQVAHDTAHDSRHSFAFPCH